MDSRAASFGLEGVRVRISSKVCTMCTPSGLPARPAHFTQQRSSCKAGTDHQAKWAGAWGGKGSELEVLEWREEDVDMWRWRAWWRLGEREQRWRGLGWRTGTGDGGNGKPSGARGGGGWWTWGGAGVLGGAWGSWSVGGGGWGWGSAYGRMGEREARWGSRGVGEVDMGRRCRTWWRLGELEGQEQGLWAVAVAPWGAGPARVGG